MKDMLIIQTEVRRCNNPPNNGINEKLSFTSLQNNLHFWFGIHQEDCVQEYKFSVLNFRLYCIYLLDWIEMDEWSTVY